MNPVLLTSCSLRWLPSYPMVPLQQPIHAPAAHAWCMVSQGYWLSPDTSIQRRYDHIFANIHPCSMTKLHQLWAVFVFFSARCWYSRRSCRTWCLHLHTKKLSDNHMWLVALCKINVGVNGALPLILVVVPEHKGSAELLKFAQESIDMII